MSTVTMMMPPISVPNAASTPDELRKIYASDATPGGYNAASNANSKRLLPHGSLDLSFQFGSKDLAKKPSGRVEQITYHIRQKLSETRLSKEAATEEPSGAEMDPLSALIHRVADEHTELLSVSQRSTGLTELLTYRAGSEGGYDSDAKSIRTPTLRSQVGMSKVSPAFARKSLEPIQSESMDEPLVPEVKAHDQSPTTPSLRRFECKSSPFPYTPTKTSFTAALQVRPNESPSDALRRLSMGIANGTVRVPDTPELRAMRTPSIHEVETKWRPCVSVPQRASSFTMESPRVSRIMKRLSDRIEAAKRDSLTSVSLEDRHDSLISELDPVLLDCIERYVDERNSDDQVEFSSPVTAIMVNKFKHTDNDSIGRFGPSSIAQSLSGSTNDVSSTTTSAGQSLHLFNMRISQRLASDSRAPLSSTVCSNNASSKSFSLSNDKEHLIQNCTSSPDRYPTFIAPEHTRCPSDPQTKKLFEPHSELTQFTRAEGSSSSAEDPLPLANGRKSILIASDGTSSFYNSASNGQATVPITSPLNQRQSSIKNQNSLAIGGRSISDALPKNVTGACTGPTSWRSDNHETCRRPSHDVYKSNGSFAVAGPLHNHDHSINVSNQPNLCRSPSTPMVKKSLITNGTEDNEEFSEESLSYVLDRKHEHMSEISIEAIHDRVNEVLGGDTPSSVSEHAAVSDDESQISDAWLTQGRRSGWGYQFVGQNLDHTSRCSVTSDRSSVPLPDASPQSLQTIVLHSTGQSETEMVPDVSPTNRSRGRTSSVTSASEQSSHRRKTSELVPRRRSQSMDESQSRTFNSLVQGRQQRKPFPVLVSVSTQVVSDNAHTWMGWSKAKKRSLLDLGRRFTALGMSGERTTPSQIPSSKRKVNVWSNFPSHTRAQRNGAAGNVDGIYTHDFREDQHPAERTDVKSTSINQSRTSLGLRPHVSRKFLSLSTPKIILSKTKSMNFTLALGERAKQNRKGLAGHFRRLYRSQSSEFRAFTGTRGHRSSISTSRDVEYPELECLPGEGAFVVSQSRPSTASIDLDGSADHRTRPAQGYSSYYQQDDRNCIDRDVPAWTNLYTECVGSLSALRSNTDIGETSHESRILSLGSALRDSTVDFETTLANEAIEVKASLTKQLQEDNQDLPQKSETKSSAASVELKMPGSFD